MPPGYARSEGSGLAGQQLSGARPSDSTEDLGAGQRSRSTPCGPPRGRRVRRSGIEDDDQGDGASLRQPLLRGLVAPCLYRHARLSQPRVRGRPRGFFDRGRNECRSQEGGGGLCRRGAGESARDRSQVVGRPSDGCRRRRRWLRSPPSGQQSAFMADQVSTIGRPQIMGGDRPVGEMEPRVEMQWS